MERWNPEKQAYVVCHIDNFIDEVLEVCKKHGFSVGSGEFINHIEIVNYSVKENETLKNATDCTTAVGQ